MRNPAEETTITQLQRRPIMYCGWPETLVPVGENLLGFLYLLIHTGKVKLHFSGSSGDQNLNGRQTAPLHSQTELFVSFLNSVLLETIHG
jgi:hypothetical protein